MFDRAFTLMPPPRKRPGLIVRYAVSYRRTKSYFTFAASAVVASDPSSYVFNEVQLSRLSPCRNQPSSSVKIEKRTFDRTCFFCDTRKPPAIDEMCVERGSSSKNAMFPLTPSVSPVDGLEPMAGARTTKCRLA